MYIYKTAKMQSYVSEEELRVVHNHLRSAYIYFESLKTRLLAGVFPSVADADTVIPLLTKTANALAAAARACGPRSRDRRPLANQEQYVVVALSSACEPLTQQIGAVQQAWTQLLEGTDRGRPNALILAMCFAVDATERFLGVVEAFVGRVLELRELLPRDRAVRDLWEHPPHAAGGRGAGGGVGRGEMPFVHPSRRGFLRSALDRARRPRPALPPRRRRVRVEL